MYQWANMVDYYIALYQGRRPFPPDGFYHQSDALKRDAQQTALNRLQARARAQVEFRESQQRHANEWYDRAASVGVNMPGLRPSE